MNVYLKIAQKKKHKNMFVKSQSLIIAKKCFVQVKSFTRHEIKPTDQFKQWRVKREPLKSKNEHLIYIFLLYFFKLLFQEMLTTQ